ncbi:MAG: hypothetical protein ABMA25_06290 [Ilumatobacteraceae bacterium]
MSRPVFALAVLAASSCGGAEKAAPDEPPTFEVVGTLPGGWAGIGAALYFALLQGTEVNADRLFCDSLASPEQSAEFLTRVSNDTYPVRGLSFRFDSIAPDASQITYSAFTSGQSQVVTLSVSADDCVEKIEVDGPLRAELFDPSA